MIVRVLLVVALVLLASCGSKSRDPGPPDPDDQTFAAAPTPTTPACEEANAKHSSVGCEYYAVHMTAEGFAENACFAVFVANTTDAPVHVGATFAGGDLDLAAHAKLPHGSGRKLKYDAFDPGAGIPAGEVAILFLAGTPKAAKATPADLDPKAVVPCPVAPALSSLTQIHGTGRGHAFHITTDAPVVAYQMMPYGGGAAAVTGATLLIPKSAWGTNYLAVAGYAGTDQSPPTTNIVAAEDGTNVTILPNVVIAPGPDVPGAQAGEPVTYTLSAGEHLQITQAKELTGSAIASDHPVAVFAGNACLVVPIGAPWCDHAEQQIPPVPAMGHEYAAVSYRQRTSKAENPPWRIIGAVDGTKLTYEPDVGGPATLRSGQVVEFATATPFHVASQDANHPFLLLSYMTGASSVDTLSEQGYGDADFVRSVPVAQYMDRYVFFTDPTYPETNLVVVRKEKNGAFADVVLDCAGPLTGWQPLGSGLEFTRIDLSRHDFEPQGSCDNGRHEMHSDATFGLWVWGWGSSETTSFTGYVSYGYPAGENVAALSSVVVPVAPR